MMHRTSDHSYVQALVDRGEITEAEANNHPHSNILVGCVWHYFSPTELGSVVDSLTPREATEFLIEKARVRARGGGDNLSLVIVKIEALQEEKKVAPLVPPPGTPAAKT